MPLAARYRHAYLIDSDLQISINPDGSHVDRYEVTLVPPTVTEHQYVTIGYNASLTDIDLETADLTLPLRGTIQIKGDKIRYFGPAMGDSLSFLGINFSGNYDVHMHTPAIPNSQGQQILHYIVTLHTKTSLDNIFSKRISPNFAGWDNVRSFKISVTLPKVLPMQITSNGMQLKQTETESSILIEGRNDPGAKEPWLYMWNARDYADLADAMATTAIRFAKGNRAVKLIMEKIKSEKNTTTPDIISIIKWMRRNIMVIDRHTLSYTPPASDNLYNYVGDDISMTNLVSYDFSYIINTKSATSFEYCNLLIALLHDINVEGKIAFVANSDGPPRPGPPTLDEFSQAVVWIPNGPGSSKGKFDISATGKENASVFLIVLDGIGDPTNLLKPSSRLVRLEEIPQAQPKAMNR